ncbi:MAG TPA: nucleotidyl transferase AbiEii/AbiGii toxin family protein [Puia sp.]|nr:nucleotidyl transferase AbiEii/AbiGii toxin family protein [Puia sp.]
MNNTSEVNWNNLYNGPLKDVFIDLEQAFHQAGIDYYIIGAQARDIWLGRPARGTETKDLDLAILVGGKEDYEQIRQHLMSSNGFHPLRDNYYAYRSPAGVQVDILPFGGMNFDEPVTAAAVTRLPVNALQEVYDQGTTVIEPDHGALFKVATLPSIMLLKLIAYDDRPENRIKDVGDIVRIIQQYASIESDYIYEHHNDLFDPDRTPIRWTTNNDLSCIVLGREINRIIEKNDALKSRTTRIIADFIARNADSPFVREMSRITNLPVSEMVYWLSLIDRTRV